MSRGDNIKGDDKTVFNQLAEAIEARDRKIAALREAANRVIDDIHDYERTNNLAPNSGRKECWDSVAALVEALTGSPSPDPAEAMRGNGNLKHFVEHIAALHRDGFPNEAESAVHANELRAAEALRAKCEAIAEAYVFEHTPSESKIIRDEIRALKGNGEGL